MPATLPAFLGVALGGALGSVLRYAISLALAPPAAPDGARLTLAASVPWATLAVNVLGSFLLGIVAESLGDRRVAGAPWKLVLGTGVMGGFTTYSTFNLETLQLVERGDARAASVYVVVTLIVCLAAGVAGRVVGRRMVGA